MGEQPAVEKQENTGDLGAPEATHEGNHRQRRLKDRAGCQTEEGDWARAGEPEAAGKNDPRDERPAFGEGSRPPEQACACREHDRQDQKLRTWVAQQLLEQRGPV